MIQLNYCEFQCPLPVIETRKQIIANPGESFTILVADQITVENISRLSGKMGYQVSVAPTDDHFQLNLTPAAASVRLPETATHQLAGKTVIFCNSDQMGHGDKEFGQILLKNFFVTLLEVDTPPDSILFVNSAVYLACRGSEALEALTQLACHGVDIASCGLCLDFYRLKDQLKIGRVTNMLEIAETQMAAARVISP